ncbi:MAG: nicotinamide-nucleotide amidohydrolase family protein, partial [Dehalococcoidales bacterium]|nr:nicotinamide-nucleotide amidohydrolase family protein [Dehalococcoidales bacterium]
ARDGRILVTLPGPPGELQEMWQQTIQPRLRQLSSGIILTKTFKTTGLSEAAAGELVAPLFAVANPILGIYAKPDGIHLRLAAKAENQEQAEKLIAGSEASIRTVLDEYIWGTDNDTPETQVGQRLIKKGLSLAVMEDYSGGWLTASINDLPDSPTFFRGGVLAQSEATKIALGVKAEIISQYGAASPEVVQAMAETARTLFKADVGVSVVGIEETAGLTSQIYIGIADGKGSRVSRVSSRVGGNRRAATSALFELRKWLITLD